MPSSDKYKRNYKQEAKTAKRRGETGNGSSSGDATRHRARRAFIDKHGTAKAAGKDIDHKKMLKNGGSNSAGNLRAVSASTNRSRNGHKKGEK